MQTLLDRMCSVQKVSQDLQQEKTFHFKILFVHACRTSPILRLRGHRVSHPLLAESGHGTDGYFQYLRNMCGVPSQIMEVGEVCLLMFGVQSSLYAT